MHEFTSRSIYFVPAFPQSELDVGVFMELPLEMVVDGNIVGWFLKLNKPLYGLKQAGENWFDLLKTGL